MRSAPLMVSSQMLAALKDKVLASSSINNNHGQAFDDAWRRHESRVNLIGKIQGLMMGYDLRLMHDPVAPGLLLSGNRLCPRPL